jgi:hypothetical protein
MQAFFFSRHKQLKCFNKEVYQFKKIKTPPLPDKAWKRQIPLISSSLVKETLFDDQFLEERRQALDQFINK